MRPNLRVPITSLIVATSALLPVESVQATSVVWNTFLGNTDMDKATDVARDADGNVYLTGESDSAWGSPVRDYSAARDVFVAKLDGDGNRVWITFLGGTGDDLSQGIAVDGDGSVYASGYSTATWGIPVKVYKANGDAYVAKLDPGTGELVWSTFIGGEGFDSGDSIAASGKSVYVGGTSSEAWGSSPVRAYVSGDDAIVVKLDGEDGSMIWHTFLGGTGFDYVVGSTTDSAGNLFVAGRTVGIGWGTPVAPYVQLTDCFVARLDPDSGTLVWNTFLGGMSLDVCSAIAADAGGSLFAAGYGYETWGNPREPFANNPVPQSKADAFAARLSAATGALAWNTFLGSTNDDYAGGIALDSVGGVYVAGESAATWGSPLQAYGAQADAFVARFEASSGVRTWNTFLGGVNGDVGLGVASDATGNLDVVGFSNQTWGSPVVAHAGGNVPEAFVARLRADLTYRDGFESP